MNTEKTKQELQDLEKLVTEMLRDADHLDYYTERVSQYTVAVKINIKNFEERLTNLKKEKRV